MEFKHKSVLLNEVIEGLDIRQDGIYVDGTLGGGGHSYEICSRLSENGMLIGIDRDTDALEAASARLADVKCRKEFVHSDFEDIKEVLGGLGVEKIDGALLDLGVSSFQLDNDQRGFSYMQDTALDMRMDRSQEFTAEDVVNDYSEDELTRVIKTYGEERWAKRIAQFIVRRRAEKRLTTTYELVDCIKAAIPANARREGPHPAKRTFQAIRIEVNDELGELERSVDEYIDVLASGGRLAIITFHSLEDRIVKERFNKRLHPCTCPPDLPECVCGRTADVRKITGKPIVPSMEETEDNPRARSAKLRIIEKL